MKSARQEKILELIKNSHIDTQEELARQLKAAGFQVTQATVSRDIRALNLTKVTGSDGRVHYAVLREEEVRILGDKYARVLKEAVVTISVGQNILVIKTVPGMAMGVAAAIDGLKWPEVLGCIAGDDTIMCVLKTNDQALEAREKLSGMLESYA